LRETLGEKERKGGWRGKILVT